MIRKNEKLGALVQHAAAAFLAKESNRTSLITVTGTRVERRGRRVTVLITVFPEENEKQTLDFVSRKCGVFRTYLGSAARLRELPEIAFALDAGEKNRQNIEGLLRKER